MGRGRKKRKRRERGGKYAPPPPPPHTHTHMHTYPHWRERGGRRVRRWKGERMYTHPYIPIPLPLSHTHAHLFSLLPWQPVGTPDHWSRQHATLRPPTPYAYQQSYDPSATLGETKVMGTDSLAVRRGERGREEREGGRRGREGGEGGREEREGGRRGREVGEEERREGRREGGRIF